MKDFMVMLTTCSAALSVVILLYAAITPLLSKRFSAKGLYYSWLIIAAGLIVPFWPQTDVHRLNVNVPGVNVKVPTEAILNRSLLTVPAMTANAAAQGNNDVVSGNTVLSPALANIQWWQLLAIVWITGAVIFLLYHCLQHYRLVKMAGRWGEDITDERVLALMESIKQDLGISGRIRLCLCRYIGSPMIIGLLNPRILLPTTDIPLEALNFILRHELVHYKRKDLWYKYLLLFAAAMHWFNPAIYLMVKVVNTQCELSCDAEVVRSSDTDTRYRYCETIIGLLGSQSKMKTVFSTNFYGGKRGMKNRILSILDSRKKKAGLLVICAALIITAGVGITSAAVNSDNAAGITTGDIDSNVVIKLAQHQKTLENPGTNVCYVDARPQLEFYIEGEDIAQIEVSCSNEYVYAVDLTETQHEKYWNADYYQTYDEKTGTCTFYPERLFDKSMKFSFDEGFSDYGDIWYRWTAWNLYQWAIEDDCSHIVGYGIDPKIEIPDDMTEEQKLMLAAGEDGSGAVNIGHICLDGYPEELAKDCITIRVTDRDGNSVTKYIDVEISNNELNQTVVTASVRDQA